MKSSINYNILSQTNIESASLNTNGMIIHRFQDTGYHHVQIYKKKILEKIIPLKVTKESKEIQLNINLSSASFKNYDCHCKNIDKDTITDRVYEIGPNTNVLFYVSYGMGDYYITVIKNEQERKKIFDSRELKSGDIFVVHILRPGTYSVINTVNKSQGQIVVSYPKVGKTKFVAPEAISIECNKTFSNNSITIQPTQGIIYRINDNSNISIKLEKPDDGNITQKDKLRWVNPISKK